MQLLATLLSIVARFVGPSADTLPGHVSATDLAKSVGVPTLIFALLHLLPFAAAVPFGPFAIVIVLDLIRRLPHSAVPGESTAPTWPSVLSGKTPAPAAAPTAAKVAFPEGSTAPAEAPEANTIRVDFPPS